MIFKVHWIINGLAEIEAESKEEAEIKMKESLEDYVKNSDQLMDKFIAQTIQGTAFQPGTDDKKTNKKDEKNKKPNDDESNKKT